MTQSICFVEYCNLCIRINRIVLRNEKKFRFRLSGDHGRVTVAVVQLGGLPLLHVTMTSSLPDRCRTTNGMKLSALAAVIPINIIPITINNTRFLN